jgi:hypothetical protein
VRQVALLQSAELQDNGPIRALFWLCTSSLMEGLRIPQSSDAATREVLQPGADENEQAPLDLSTVLATFLQTLLADGTVTFTVQTTLGGDAQDKHQHDATIYAGLAAQFIDQNPQILDQLMADKLHGNSSSRCSVECVDTIRRTADQLEHWRWCS